RTISRKNATAPVAIASSIVPSTTLRRRADAASVSNNLGAVHSVRTRSMARAASVPDSSTTQWTATDASSTAAVASAPGITLFADDAGAVEFRSWAELRARPDRVGAANQLVPVGI